MRVYFDYLNLRFDLTKARELSQNVKYSAKTAKPKPSWLAPFINIADIEVDLSQVVLFVTLLYEVKPTNLLVDGNEVVKWALGNDAEVTFKILDLLDSAQVMSGDPAMKKLMTQQAKGIRLYERE